ncbi:MAG: (2Fe-2S) ferredoxin domain-containing protein, partial [Clostridia bacterium]
MFRSHILVCGGTGCHSNHSSEIFDKFESEIKAQGLSSEAQVVKTGCFGLCAVGPVVIIYPEGTFYSEIKPDDVSEIVAEHLIKGRIVERLVYKDHKTTEIVKSLSDTNFYKKQTRIALRNCG